MGADEQLRQAVSEDAVRADAVLVKEPEAALLSRAAEIRDQRFGSTVTFSPKIFIPLTQLCRDVCHYCTFAKTPAQLDALYIDADSVVATAVAGARAGGCVENPYDHGPVGRNRRDSGRALT